VRGAGGATIDEKSNARLGNLLSGLRKGVTP
jgi:hypothetical protein